MTLLAVSINHKTASMDVLARVAMSRDDSADLARELGECPHVGETLVVSTCNRTEVYVDTTRFHAGLETIVGPLAERAGVARADLPALCSVFYDDAAVEHCFSLVSGLDSLVVGERQVLGQVRDALSQAQQDSTSGPAINELFQSALRVGKRVQSETTIGSAGRSVLTAAVEQLEQRGIAVEGAQCLVVGAGAIAGLAARSLAARAAHVDCANRTFAKAERLANEVGGKAVPLDQLVDVVGDYDIVVTCTGASGGLLSAEVLGDGPVPGAVLDLAMPPDVAADVVDKGVELVNLASLKESNGVDLEDVAAAQQLVDSEVAAFLARRRAAAVTPTVVALRGMAQEVVAAELARVERRLVGLDEQALAEVGNALNRVAEKLIHSPTVRVREFASQEAEVDYAAALRKLFALDPQRVATADPGECEVLRLGAVAPADARAAKSPQTEEM